MPAWFPKHAKRLHAFFLKLFGVAGKRNVEMQVGGGPVSIYEMAQRRYLSHKRIVYLGASIMERLIRIGTILSCCEHRKDTVYNPNTAGGDSWRL